MPGDVEAVAAEIQREFKRVQRAVGSYIADWEEVAEESSARRDLRAWLWAWVEIDGDEGEE